MTGSTSRRIAQLSATLLWLAGVAVATSCAGPVASGATILSCPSLEAEEALTVSPVPERYQIEFILAGADCRSHNRRVTGDRGTP